MERATTALAALQALANRIGRVKSEDPTGRQFKTEDQQVKTEDEDAEAAGGEPHAACGAGSAGWQPVTVEEMERSCQEVDAALEVLERDETPLNLRHQPTPPPGATFKAAKTKPGEGGAPDTITASDLWGHLRTAQVPEEGGAGKGNANAREDEMRGGRGEREEEEEEAVPQEGFFKRFLGKMRQ